MDAEDQNKAAVIVDFSRTSSTMDTESRSEQSSVVTAQPTYGMMSSPSDSQLTSQQSQRSSTRAARVTLQMPFDEAHSEREWSTGLFQCARSQRPCCLWCCCWPYLRYTVATRLGETPFMPLLPCAAFAMRIKIRTLLSLKGSLIEDFFTACCCEPCVVCQMSNELDAIGL